MSLKISWINFPQYKVNRITLNEFYHLFWIFFDIFKSENKAVIMRAQKFRQAEAKKQLEKRFEIDNETSKRLEFDRAVMEKKIELGFFKLDKSQQVFYTQMLEKKRLDDLELKKSYSFYFLIK